MRHGRDRGNVTVVHRLQRQGSGAHCEYATLCGEVEEQRRSVHPDSCHPSSSLPSPSSLLFLPSLPLPSLQAFVSSRCLLWVGSRCSRSCGAGWVRRLGTPSTPCRKNVILIVEFSNPQTAVVKFVSKERLFEWKVEQKTVFSECGKVVEVDIFRITDLKLLSFFLSRLGFAASDVGRCGEGDL